MWFVFLPSTALCPVGQHSRFRRRPLTTATTFCSSLVLASFVFLKFLIVHSLVLVDVLSIPFLISLHYISSIIYCRSYLHSHICFMRYQRHSIRASFFLTFDTTGWLAAISHRRKNQPVNPSMNRPTHQYTSHPRYQSALHTETVTRQRRKVSGA